MNVYVWTDETAPTTTVVGTGTLPPPDTSGVCLAGPWEAQSGDSSLASPALIVGLLLGIGVGRFMIRVKIITTATRRAFRL